MLIDTTVDTLANTSLIETIEELPHVPGQGERSKITFTSGRSIVAPRCFDYFRNFTGAIVPAPPGYTVIRMVEGDFGPEFYTTPVLAFRYDGQIGGPLAPITDEGPISDPENWALIRPDGTVTNWDRSFDNVEEYKADVAEKQRQDLAA